MLDVLELDLTGKTVTTDALLTQRALAEFLHRHRAHFVFCVKLVFDSEAVDVRPET